MFTTMVVKKSIWEKLFDIGNILFMLLLMIISLYPFYYILVASFSEPELLMQHRGFLLKPVGFSIVGYEAVINNADIYIGYKNTIIYVVATVVLSVVVSSMFAYGLSLKRLKYTKYLMIMLTITMFFGGGMIPTYLVVKACGLLNTGWSVILPGLVSAYNVIVLKTAFMGIPDSLSEAATIDGAGDFHIYARIVMPLSGATIAVIVLFVAVATWNSWFNAMIYIKDRDLFPLQLFLREILVNADSNKMLEGTDSGEVAVSRKVIEHATVIVATVPVLCIYPFIQKYFVNGVMIGAVKG